MQIELTKFLNSISLALDYVEGEYLRTALERAKAVATDAAAEYVKESQSLKVAPNHAKRVAVITNRMALVNGLDAKTIYALTQAALLHDCALQEYLTDEFISRNIFDLKPHCIAGEKIVSGLPFYDEIHDIVLYHHERPDGAGPFGKCSGEIPSGSEMIHLADDLDIRFSLDSMDEEKFRQILDFVPTQIGRLYTAQSAETFMKIATLELMESITGENSTAAIYQLLPNIKAEVSADILRKMSLIFADITDYKSHFTWRHSLGVAEKAEAMGRYYGYNDELCDELYIAGALHDVGKLFISNDILEKPGKLTTDEYKEVQNHAMGTWKLLKGIGGLEEITSWAANHHEKLDGSGYPYCRTADNLSHNDRLMACIDIYQALVEERPYKAGLSHTDAMAIINKMGEDGQLDKSILADLDKCFAGSVEPSENKAAEKPKTESEPKVYSGEAWRCPVCGYVYEGELPDDFICPQCEQPASIFEPIGMVQSGTK